MKKITILFGIVCFREKYWEAQSFKNLIDSYQKFTTKINLNICIYDNTDFNDWELYPKHLQQENIILDYYRDASNSGISAAFNYFAKLSKQKGIEWVVFLDQDTSLPEDFFSKYYHTAIKTDKNILFPKIFLGEHLLSPSHYRYFRTSKIEKISSEIILKNITAINSGLMVKTEFFLVNGGYNKNLRVDFCDHEFIEKINNKNVVADIIDVTLHQEFSAKTNNKSKSIERYKIYVKDLRVYKKNKNKVLFLFRVDLPHLLKEIYRNRSLEFLKIRIKP